MYVEMQCPRRPEEVAGSPGAGVTGDCKPANRRAGKQTGPHRGAATAEPPP